MNREIGALTEKLQPADGSAIAKHLLSLRKAGMSIPNGMKPDDLEAVYTYALSDVPAFGLRRAVEKIIKGEYQIKYGFMPLPPELAAMARAEAKATRDDLVRLREKEATLRDLAKKPDDRPDEAAKERMRQLLENFRIDTAAARVSMTVPQEPMSNERAAYFEAIMDLRDKPGGPDASEAAYRRKVNAEIEASRKVEE